MPIIDRLNAAKSFVQQQQGQKQYIEKELKGQQTKLLETQKLLHDNEKALEIVKEVGKKTQELLQFQISDITSLAMEAVFDDPYKLQVLFVERRNKNECDLLFERDGQLISPLDASGGGAVDVAAFALRIVSWSLSTPKLRNTIILDEPLRFLDRTKQEKASQMIKHLSKKLGIQFIIVTHETKLAESADRVFEVVNTKGISKIK